MKFKCDPLWYPISKLPDFTNGPFSRRNLIPHVYSGRLRNKFCCRRKRRYIRIGLVVWPPRLGRLNWHTANETRRRNVLRSSVVEPCAKSSIFLKRDPVAADTLSSFPLAPFAPNSSPSSRRKLPCVHKCRATVVRTIIHIQTNGVANHIKTFRYSTENRWPRDSRCKRRHIIPVSRTTDVRKRCEFRFDLTERVCEHVPLNWKKKRRI